MASTIRRLLATTAGIACTLAVVGCGSTVGGAGSASSAGSGSDPDGSERFDVPTYEWDRDAGMAALLSGRLAFTPQGCTLLVPLEDGRLPQPVLFPNASGLRFANGVRAVIEADTGKVYATEGQEFSYGGGGVDATETWTDQCGEYTPDSVNLINDLPAHPVPTADPEPYAGSLPDSIPSQAERGWYAVPTFEWDPAQGGDAAALEGTVTITEDGCPVIRPAADGGEGAVGLVLPHALGSRGSNWVAEDQAVIYSFFPDGMSTAMAEDGQDVSFAGGMTEMSGEFGDQWAELCPNSPVDELFLVQDTDGFP